MDGASFQVFQKPNDGYAVSIQGQKIRKDDTLLSAWEIIDACSTVLSHQDVYARRRSVYTMLDNMNESMSENTIFDGGKPLEKRSERNHVQPQPFQISERPSEKHGYLNSNKTSIGMDF